MSRRIYETELDRHRQREIANYTCTVQGWSLVKEYEPLHFCDYMLDTGARRALLECKWRDIQYADALLIEKWKIDKILKECATHGFTPMVAAVFVDKRRLGLWHPLREGYKVGVGGRTDRGDEKDVSEVCYLPYDEALFHSLYF